MITAHVERLSDTMEELKPHFDPHWQELALNQDKVPLDPQYAVYFERENVGQVLLVVLREAGKVVAYFVGFVAPALHYQTCLTLQMDIFWLHPDYRDADSLTQLEAHMLSMQLFEAVREEAKRRGVKRVFFGSKLHKDASRVFEELGMVEVERYYSQWLGE
jgi:GNAT superfamily N-acetyltransferase